MPNTTCDLHMHSYYSDGCNSPADLLHHAADMGLKTLALTDHDTLAGLAEAQHVADRLGLELIPGVELTCTWEAARAPRSPMCWATSSTRATRRCWRPAGRRARISRRASSKPAGRWRTRVFT